MSRLELKPELKIQTKSTSEPETELEADSARFKAERESSTSLPGGNQVDGLPPGVHTDADEFWFRSFLA